MRDKVIECLAKHDLEGLMHWEGMPRDEYSPEADRILPFLSKEIDKETLAKEIKTIWYQMFHGYMAGVSKDILDDDGYDFESLAEDLLEIQKEFKNNPHKG